MTSQNSAVTGHRDAVHRFVAAASAVPAERWTDPAAPGKWSAAELTEHLSMTYDGVLRELAGGPAIRVRFTGLKLLVVRLVVMRRFLGQGIVPPGVRAPKEVVPVSANPDPVAALARFQDRASEFEREIASRLSDRKGRVTHPFFGRLTMAQGLRFAEVHIRHHTKQVPSG